MFALKITAKWLTFLASHILFKSSTWKKSLKRQGEYKWKYICDIFWMHVFPLDGVLKLCENIIMLLQVLKFYMYISFVFMVHDYTVHYCICVIFFVL